MNQLIKDRITILVSDNIEEVYNTAKAMAKEMESEITIKRFGDTVYFFI